MDSVKANISILVTSFTSGGAEKVISLLLKPLVSDFKVTLVLFYNEVHFSIPKDVETIILKENDPSQSVLSKFTDLFFFYRKYSQIVKDRNIDYSLSFLAFPNLINGLLAKKKRKYKVLLSERGFPSDNTTSKISHIISKVAYPILYNRCDRLFSNSTFINDDLKNNFGVKIPMEVIYNPIEIPKETKRPSDYQEPMKVLNLVTVGSVDKRKNQAMVIRALKSAANPNIKFDVYGAGPLEDFVGKLVADSDLNEQVKLRGRVKNVNDYLLKSDCFILSSFTEGFPNALLEAMAVGLPSISTNCLSGPLEMLNDNKPISIKKGEFVEVEYGILINNDDDTALAKAILFLKNSPLTMKKYSEKSLRRSHDYALNTIYSKFKAFLLKK